VYATANAPRKREIRRTPVPGARAVVVTVRYESGRWETRVIGGWLDGWTLAATGGREAGAIHRGAVRLVREAARG
jgi:hypothetical protein